LRDWVDWTLRGTGFGMAAAAEIAERVLLRLDLVPPAADGDEDDDALEDGAVARRFLAYGVPAGLLPDVVDAVLFLLPTGLPMPVAPPPQGKIAVMAAFMGAASRSSLMWADGRRTALASLLDDALSVLRIRPGGRGLERRADPDAEAAFEEAVTGAEGVAAAGSAAAHLRVAWGAVHALHPDPAKGYSEAIKAVEAAAHSVVEPGNRKATLGSMIRYLREHPERFSLAIVGRDGRGDVGPLIGCMALLWEGQSSRHGSSAPTRMESPEEAAMAVHLAVMLVQWFVSGAVRRRSVLPKGAALGRRPRVGAGLLYGYVGRRRAGVGGRATLPGRRVSARGSGISGRAGLPYGFLQRVGFFDGEAVCGLGAVLVGHLVRSPTGGCVGSRRCRAGGAGCSIADADRVTCRAFR
jgi:hypothetical protein